MPGPRKNLTPLDMKMLGLAYNQGGIINFLGKQPEVTAPQRSKHTQHCLLYTSPSPRDGLLSRMPSSA